MMLEDVKERWHDALEELSCRNCGTMGYDSWVYIARAGNKGGIGWRMGCAIAVGLVKMNPLVSSVAADFYSC